MRHPREPDPAAALTVAQVAGRLNVSESTVRRRIRSRELAAVKLGRRTLRVTPEALAAYVREHPAR